jgi:hypothetical protein
MTEKERKLAGERGMGREGWKGVGEEPNQTTARKHGPSGRNTSCYLRKLVIRFCTSIANEYERNFA